MRQKSETPKVSSERIVKDIRRATRRSGPHSKLESRRARPLMPFFKQPPRGPFPCVFPGAYRITMRGAPEVTIVFGKFVRAFPIHRSKISQ
jgi:hypothetical protein